MNLRSYYSLYPTSFAGHCISFMDTAIVYAHSSHVTTDFDFSTAGDGGQESIQDSQSSWVSVSLPDGRC